MDPAQDPPRPTRLISQLLLMDGDLRDVVVEFVDGLAQRAAELQQAHDRLDWELLTILAHRLKGAAGSYGYPDISQLCAAMENHFRAHEGTQFTDWLEQLRSLALAAVAGLGSETEG